jgi:hypothetical protein
MQKLQPQKSNFFYFFAVFLAKSKIISNFAIEIEIKEGAKLSPLLLSLYFI